MTPLIFYCASVSLSSHNSSLNPHHSPLITHPSSLVTHPSSLTPGHLPRHRSPLIALPSSLTPHHLPLFIHPSSFTPQYSPSSLSPHHSPLIIHPLSLTSHHMLQKSPFFACQIDVWIAAIFQPGLKEFVLSIFREKFTSHLLEFISVVIFPISLLLTKIL